MLAKIQSDGNLTFFTPFYDRNIGSAICVTTMDLFTNTGWKFLFKGGDSPIATSKLETFLALKKEDV